jgi:hypothetical protein
MEVEVLLCMSTCLKIHSFQTSGKIEKHKWKSSHFKTNLVSHQKNKKLIMSLENPPTINRPQSM